MKLWPKNAPVRLGALPVMGAVLLSVFLFLGAAGQAGAHRPDEGTPDGVTGIPSLSTSYAYYRSLTPEQPVQVYEFQGEQGEFVHVGVNIPQLAGLEDYGISMALLGPGLPPVTPTDLPIGLLQTSGQSLMLESLNQQFAHGKVAGLIVESTTSAAFFEPFTQTRYWGRQTLELDLPAAGSYYLLVWHPAGVAGKYVIDTGYQEVFGPADLFRFPLWWLETRLYFEQGLRLGLVAAALLGAGVILIFLHRWNARRRREAPQQQVTPFPVGV